MKGGFVFLLLAAAIFMAIQFGLIPLVVIAAFVVAVLAAAGAAGQTMQ